MLRATPRTAFALTLALLITTLLFTSSRPSQPPLPLTPSSKSTDDFSEPKDEETLRAGSKANYPYRRPAQFPWNPPNLPKNSTTAPEPAPERFLVLVKPAGEDDDLNDPFIKEQDTLKTWLDTTLPTWSTKVIELDPSFSGLHAGGRRVDKGRIADAYLRYIIENYHNLPSIIAFLAASPSPFPTFTSSLVSPTKSSSVHPATQSKGPSKQLSTSDLMPKAESSPLSARDRSRITALQNLDTDYLSSKGLTPLTCTPCATLHPSNPTASLRTLEAPISKVWARLFSPSCLAPDSNPKSPDSCPLPPAQLATPLGNADATSRSQSLSFAVTGAQIRRRPVKEYLHYWTWLNKTVMDDDSAGEVLGWVWHVILGMGDAWCPFGVGEVEKEAVACDCEVYGRCG
ncbi:hypothetical protein K491DRAFT_501300 [Lophiostoma macrostomum CBS 122681]|uniref:Uncharacterized protein n=1 Tax=Lophiostoma macrostomum CBS 122681 TaxID=1314788 RepID=A0A6A6T1A7_9PLEO|nr:hypothetical protein K491DRAFT_501300 [Lophiostoma macrostomum CBS 122681]